MQAGRRERNALATLIFSSRPRLIKFLRRKKYRLLKKSICSTTNLLTAEQWQILQRGLVLVDTEGEVFRPRDWRRQMESHCATKKQRHMADAQAAVAENSASTRQTTYVAKGGLFTYETEQERKSTEDNRQRKLAVTPSTARLNFHLTHVFGCSVAGCALAAASVSVACKCQPPQSHSEYGNVEDYAVPKHTVLPAAAICPADRLFLLFEYNHVRGRKEMRGWASHRSPHSALLPQHHRRVQKDKHRVRAAPSSVL